MWFWCKHIQQQMGINHVPRQDFATDLTLCVEVEKVRSSRSDAILWASGDPGIIECLECPPTGPVLAQSWNVEGDGNTQ